MSPFQCFVELAEHNILSDLLVMRSILTRGEVRRPLQKAARKCRSSIKIRLAMASSQGKDMLTRRAASSRYSISRQDKQAGAIQADALSSPFVMWFSHRGFTFFVRR